MRKKRFYIHTNIVNKKLGIKTSETHFSRNTRIVQAKNVGKKIVGKRWKNFFYIDTNIVTKKREEKNARNNFSRNTRIVRAKNDGEKIVGIECEKCFSY